MSFDHEYEYLNAARYLYLRELKEPKDNSLRIVVGEAAVRRSAQARPEAAGTFTEMSRIETTKDYSSFELFWNHYVAYLVTEELVGSNGTCDDEVFTGGVFRIYTKSHFLEHLARDTGGHFEPILHYKMICLSHLIDVASCTPPEIRQISPHA